jgi:hypothetical protein
MMIGSRPPASLAQRTGSALADALRQARQSEPLEADGRIRRIGDLLIEGIADHQLPDSIDRTRLKSPQSPAALSINSFLPWQRAPDQLPLCGWVGFDAVQFEVRCPTGLRGTPPHLDLLALREGIAVAVTVRCIEYLSRRRSPVASSYDRLLAATPALDPWQRVLQELREQPGRYRHLDPGGLVKYALALGRTFPDRSTTLLYLFWEPLNAGQFEEFRRHRAELEALGKAVEGAQVAFQAESFEALWREWAERRQPAWLEGHVARLRARYGVRVATNGPL